jgi:hypothetical protein
VTATPAGAESGSAAFPYGIPPNLSVGPGAIISGTLEYLPSYGPPLSSPPLVTVTVTDSASPIPNSVTASYIIDISLPTALTILTDSLPQGSVGGSLYFGVLTVAAGTPPYAWSVSSGALPPGLSLYSSTDNPTEILGTPTAAGTFNFTVEITDSSNPVSTYTSQLSITIQPQIAVTTSTLPPGTVGTAYAEPLQATGGVPPYYFALQGGSLPAGLSVASAIAGVPASTGTSGFTVVATDSQKATSTANLSITINAADCPRNSTLQGNYAFLLASPETVISFSTFSLMYVGSFVADGAGNITQGLVDSGSSFASGTQPSVVTGTDCISANNLGTVTLTGLTAGGQIPAANTFEIAFDASGNGNATIYENAPIDGLTAPALSGVLLKQDTSAFDTSKIIGNYAFGLLGSDDLRLSPLVGGFSADGAGNLTSGELDANSSSTGDVTTAATFSANDLIVATTGRGTFSFSVEPLGTLDFVFYVVNGSQLLALETQPQANPEAVLAGQMVQQSSGSYTNSSLDGLSVVGVQSLDGGELPVVQVGLITWDGAGNFTWTADQNDAGVMSTHSYTGTYSVAANGRATLSVNGLAHSPILYLTGQNQGFVMGTDAGATEGLFFNQSGSPFDAASFAGEYLGGNWQPTMVNVSLEVDALTSDGIVNVTGTSDNYISIESPLFYPASNSVSGTYAVSSTGRGTITQNGSVTGIFYVVSPTEVLMIPNVDPDPKVITLSH